jgi:Phage integrase SAM-like domain
MAWMERRSCGFLVRVWFDGRKVIDSTHASEDVARLRVLQLHTMRYDARMRRRPGATPTFAQWAADWLAVRPVAVETADTYCVQLRKHLLPEFGRLHLEQIDQPTIRRFITSLQARGLAPITIRTLVTLLGTLLRDAIRIGYLAQDPTAGIRIPREQPPPRRVLEAEQIRLLADRMPTTRLSTMVITAAFTGLRPGESAAVQTTNLRTDDPGVLGLPYIYVHPTHGNRHDHNGRRWLGPVKNQASVRHVFLPPFLHELLDALLDGGRQLLFGDRDGQLLARHEFNTLWRAACDGDGRRRWKPISTGLRFYALRHNHRAWMDEDGITEDIQSARLGHQRRHHRRPPARLLAARQQPLLDALQDRWLGLTSA